MAKKKSKSNRLKRRKSRRRTNAESTSTPRPSWIELPIDITSNILQRLSAIEILETAQKVCTTWRSVSQLDPVMWRVIDMKNSGDQPYDLERMCRRAVDLSQGQAIEISITSFGTDELLRYISERCGMVKCLRLSCCYKLSSEGLHEVVKKLPQLEELQILFVRFISAKAIEDIGRSCPMLKSFTYNEFNKCYPFIKDDDYALAIARSMPNLRHLQLLGNTMTNTGLQAILDECRHLESLDLRQCFNVVLGGDIEKRCSEQIKYMKRPYDTTRDCELFKFASCFESFDMFDDLYYADSIRYF